MNLFYSSIEISPVLEQSHRNVTILLQNRPTDGSEPRKLEAGIDLYPVVYAGKDRFVARIRSIETSLNNTSELYGDLVIGAIPQQLSECLRRNGLGMLMLTGFDDDTQAWTGPILGRTEYSPMLDFHQITPVLIRRCAIRLQDAGFTFERHCVIHPHP